MKKFGALSSSADPNKLSATVQGIGLMVVPLVIIAGKFLGVDLAESDLADLVQQLSAAVAAVVIAYGGIRKLFYRFIKVE